GVGDDVRVAVHERDPLQDRLVRRLRDRELGPRLRVAEEGAKAVARAPIEVLFSVFSITERLRNRDDSLVLVVAERHDDVRYLERARGAVERDRRRTSAEGKQHDGDGEEQGDAHWLQTTVALGPWIVTLTAAAEAPAAGVRCAPTTSPRRGSRPETR